MGTDHSTSLLNRCRARQAQRSFAADESLLAPLASPPLFSDIDGEQGEREGGESLNYGQSPDPAEPWQQGFLNFSLPGFTV